VGLALRRRVPAVQIVGTSRSAQRRELAVSRGAVDIALESVQQACADCDVVVVASPVDRIASMVLRAADATPPDCLITDVGSTKATIVQAVEKEPTAAAKFLAAHPIAGSEKTGVQHASESLFDRRVIVLTPSQTTAESLTTKGQRFWQLTGGQTIRMSPDEHDTHLAAVSHVPHLVAALVARMVDPAARPLVGSGWRDMTRVAAGDPTMWTAICRENRAAISQQLGQLAQSLSQLHRMVDSQNDDELFRWLAEAKHAKEET
jgi:prephenate dehydrogenase